MSKKRKPLKKSISNSTGGYKNFIQDLFVTLKKVDFIGSFSKMSLHDKKKMWDYKLVIRSPKRGNQKISNSEIKNIAQQTKKYFYLPAKKVRDIKISCYELLLLNCYCQIHAQKTAKEIDDEYHPEVIEALNLKNATLEAFHSQYFLDYFRILIRMNHPAKKYFGVDMRMAYIFKDNPSFEIETSLHKFDAIKRYIDLNGIKRPAFRLAKPIANGPIVWVTAPKDFVNDFYTGEKEELDVYIQSHALKRMSDRLDALSQEAVNYILWENTTGFDNFMTYRGYLFLPIKIHNIKIGYLLANIIDDIILFRTFLFITHNSTPEGDKLKQVSGLGKHDISYWQIDRLSTLLNFEEKKYPGLSKLFQEAGIGNISELKEEELDIETLQEANLNGLEEYIKQGELERA